ncbi:MAG: radical SAM protein [Papillibacter sp.]|jgi:uncharacterized radical SAM superfamily Fe-S cluster-containing enzyme|nr:radical SAM protein [Papillibacter sp.]
MLEHTKSVCPVCLKQLDAVRVSKADGIYLEKSCSEHGAFSVLIWEGSEKSYREWNRGNSNKDKIAAALPVNKGCPYDCGLCQAHERSGCCVLLELTKRCNLSCPVCFASAGSEGTDPGLAEIDELYSRLMKSGGPFNIQLSGGEPTVRDDLPEIIRLGLSRGFTFFQLNTNGIRLGKEAGYAKKLKDAGLNTVFLQFDGLSDKIYETLRGRPLLKEKLAAIKRCGEAGLGVVLVPTVAPGVNDGELGNILRYAVKHMPQIRGVHFQPLSYFGRCSLPVPDKRITIPYMLKNIESQTSGSMKAADFSCGGAENPYCSFHASYIKQADGSLKALAKRGGSGCCCTTSAQSRDSVARQWSGAKKIKVKTAAGSFDEFLVEIHNSTLAISGMLFQDAYNLDLERLKRCYINEADSRYGLVPFCAYNLSSVTGETLYR